MNTKRILKRIAKENNVSVGEVEREIKEAIRLSMQSKSPCAQKLWGNIDCDKDIDLHTIEYFLKTCCGMVGNQRN